MRRYHYELFAREPMLSKVYAYSDRLGTLGNKKHLAPSDVYNDRAWTRFVSRELHKDKLFTEIKVTSGYSTHAHVASVEATYVEEPCVPLKPVDQLACPYCGDMHTLKTSEIQIGKYGLICSSCSDRMYYLVKAPMLIKLFGPIEIDRSLYRLTIKDLVVGLDEVNQDRASTDQLSWEWI